MAERTNYGAYLELAKRACFTWRRGLKRGEKEERGDFFEKKLFFSEKLP